MCSTGRMQEDRAFSRDLLKRTGARSTPDVGLRVCGRIAQIDGEPTARGFALKKSQSRSGSIHQPFAAGSPRGRSDHRQALCHERCLPRLLGELGSQGLALGTR
jgi:hypothetical protein